MAKFFMLLGAVVLLLVVAAVVLFVRGRRADGGLFHASIAIDRPPADVFPWLVEDHHLKQWVTWLVEVRGAPATGPAAVGHKAVMVMNDPNSKKQFLIESELTAVDPPRALSVKLELPGFFTGTASYALTPKDGGTVLDYQARYSYHSALYALMEPLITPQAQKKLEGDLRLLKAKVEAAPASVAR